MILALGTCLCSGARAAEPVAIQVVPAKLELAGEGRATATVLVSNTSDAAIVGLRLRPVFGAASAPAATLRPKRVLRLGAGQVREYRLSIGPWGSPRAPAGLSLLATYATAATADKAQRRMATVAAVELTARAPLEVEKLAAVEVKASLETLRSGQTEPVYLLVSNKSSQRLKVKRVVPSHPDFIEFEGERRSLAVPPGQVGLLTLEAKAEDEVEPGDHQLVFRLPAEIGGTDFDLVASQKTTVGVAGESEVLTVLGIPSLLVLPGFLVLAAIILLWKFIRPAWLPKDFPLTLKEPDFWVLAVFGSIAIVLLADPIGHIDLLGRYGLNDLVALWIASMGLGVAIYAALVGALWLWRRSRIPTGDDDPVKILRKLGRRNLDIKRPRLHHDVGSGTQIELFAVEPLSETRKSTWCCPTINFTWKADVDPELNRQINRQLDEAHDAGALAGLLRKGEKGGKLTASFAGNRSPLPIESEKIGDTTRKVMVEAP